MAKSYWTPARKGAINMDDLAREVYKKNTVKKPVIVRSKKHSRWCAGICKDCGEYFEMITHAHAEMHGYTSPTEMAEKGNIDWMDYV